MGLQEAEAATLPLNYVSREFRVVPGADMRNGATEFTTNQAFSGSSDPVATCVDNTNTSLIKNGGAKNVVLTMTGSGGTYTHHLRCTLSSLSLDTNPTVSLRTYSDTGYNSNVLYLSNDTGLSNNFSLPLSVSNPVAGLSNQGWVFYQWHRDNSTVGAGSPSWLTDFTRIRHLPSTGNGSTGIIYFDQHYYDGYQHPVIPWIFEGAAGTHYSVVFAAFTAFGLTGTLAIPTGLVDTSTFLTTAQIDEMYAAGWDVIHMSDTTTALTGLSVAASEARLGTAETFMTTKGWTRTPKVIALPGISFTTHRSDANLITALTNRGYFAAINKWSDGTSGVTTNAQSIDPHYGISLNPYRVPAWRAENPDTLAEHRLHYGAAIAGGGPRIFRTGGIEAAPSSGEMASADFATMLGELAIKHHANTLSVLTWRKFYSGLSGRMVR